MWRVIISLEFKMVDFSIFYTTTPFQPPHYKCKDKINELALHIRKNVID